jgi:DNA-binding SARP family transcriptional activator/tetratricopeptide (TPR) repeat protein
MEFRLLGPLEVSIGGRQLDVGPPQLRLVLAVLAAEAGSPVAMESLIDRVWDERPEQPRRALQVYISRVRQRLAGAELSGQPPPGVVVRRSGGYLLDVDSDRVDVHRFQRLLRVARERESSHAERAAVLGEALALWRGRPLADLPGRWAERMRQSWQQQYLEAVVTWALADMQVNDPRAVLPRLSELVDEHPLVEPLAAAYLRALSLAGRPAEALEHYAAVRRRLAEELGADPSADLQRIHQQILSADPVPGVPTTSAQGGLPLVPRQLPAPPHQFTGRTTELAVIEQVHDASTVVISAIDGMAGVGKTALAVHAAHRIGVGYPDGQLFIDLHGYTEGVGPVEPGEALDRMLRVLGIPGPQIPSGLDDRAALYRTRLADRQMLIVLDNAATETQVTPLLPGVPGCLVLVTSRRRLAGLDHVRALSLDVLPVPDAVRLFTHTVGAERLHGQPHELLVELVALCGRLPLAIRIAAARMRSRRTWQLTDLLDRLRDRQNRLSELEVGQRSVTAALDLSYQDLSGAEQRTYRVLGLHPGADIDAYAAAALLHCTFKQAQRTLDGLLDAHLLQEPVAGRYRFHDLIRAHAAETAARDESEHTRRAALGRLLDYYRQATATAMDSAYPYERERRPQVPPADTPVPEPASPESALQWLDTELSGLVAAARWATEHGWAEHVLHLSAILHPHIRTHGRYHDAVTLHAHARSAARAIGDQSGELVALNGLGHIHRKQGQHAQAAEHYEQALRLARASGHRPGEMDALIGLGHTHLLQNRHAQATEHYQRVLRIGRASDHQPGQLEALLGLGHVHLMESDHAPAAEYYQQAMQLACASGHRPGELDALLGLGLIHLTQGRHAQAADKYRQVLRIARATGHRHVELVALNGLGNVHRIEGRPAQAADHYHQLLDLARQTGNRNWQFEAWQSLGRLRHATGDPAAALAHHDKALALAGELGQPIDQARAHNGLAHAHHALTQHRQARDHWQRALGILTHLGVDHTYDEGTNVDAIRDHLASLDPQPVLTESALD